MTEANNRSYVGIDAIVQTCSKIYPDQLNPTQATSVVKYWYSYSRQQWELFELLIDFLGLVDLNA